MALRPSEKIAPLPNGSLLMEHVIEDTIGRGGFGIVYRVRHPRLNRLAAIKEFCPSILARRDEDQAIVPYSGEEGRYAEILARFEETAAQLCTLHHANIVQLQNQSNANNTSYVLMDFVEGLPLSTWVEQNLNSLDPLLLWSMLEPLLDAVSYLHSRRMLHRDIAPDNILIRDDGQPVLIDFGTLKAHALQEDTSLENDEEHNPSALISKRFFSPPEQTSKASKTELTWSGDIYSLSATLYDVLAGRADDGTRHLASAEDRLLEEATLKTSTMPPLREVCRVPLPGAFCDAIDQGLRIKALERPQSVEAFRDRIAAGLKMARPKPPPLLADGPIDKTPPRSKFPVALTLVVGLVFAGAGYLLLGPNGGKSGSGDSTDTGLSLPERPDPVVALPERKDETTPTLEELGGNAFDESALPTERLENIVTASNQCGQIRSVTLGESVHLIGHVDGQADRNRLVTELMEAGLRDVDTQHVSTATRRFCAAQRVFLGIAEGGLDAPVSVMMSADENIIGLLDLPPSDDSTPIVAQISRGDLPEGSYIWAGLVFWNDGDYRLLPLFRNTLFPYEKIQGDSFGIASAGEAVFDVTFEKDGEYASFLVLALDRAGAQLPGLPEDSLPFPDQYMADLQEALVASGSNVLTAFARPIYLGNP